MKETTEMILEAINQMSGRFDRLEEQIAERFDRVEERLDRVEERLDRLEEEVAALKADMQDVKARVDRLEMKVASIEMTLENVTNRNIQIVAEGHFDLKRKMEDVLKVEDEKERLLVRVNFMEDDIRKIKEFYAAGAANA
ncbi:MAG: hypothetical protein J6E44_07360 [Lachnospiraceae bacterium]|nr:hypothetical protein [Lachnospiraceae bacterium]